MTKKMFFIALISGLVALAAFCFHSVPWCLSIAITAAAVCFHFSMRLIVGSLVPFAARRRFDPNSAWFREKKGERAFYKAFGIAKIKRHLPTASPEKFDLARGVDAVVQATCEAEIVHALIIALGYLPIVPAAILGDAVDAILFAATSFLAGLIDFLFLAVQRYNRPRLLRMKEIESRRAAASDADSSKVSAASDAVSGVSPSAD